MGEEPHNVVSEYGRNYSRSDEIVLDPFVGSGVTAVKLGRKAIGIDLNPMGIFLSRMTGKPVDLEEISKAFAQIANNCQREIESFYETECAKCGAPATILASVWDRVADSLVDIQYSRIRTEAKRTALEAISSPVFEATVHQNVHQVVGSNSAENAKLLN